MSISEGLVSASLLWFGGFSIHQAPSKLLVFKAVRDRRDLGTVWFACFGAKGTEGLGSGYVVQGQPAGSVQNWGGGAVLPWPGVQGSAHAPRPLAVWLSELWLTFGPGSGVAHAFLVPVLTFLQLPSHLPCPGASHCLFMPIHPGHCPVDLPASCLG